MTHVNILSRQSAVVLEFLAAFCRTGTCVPIVSDGRIVCFTSRWNAARIALPDPLPVADYIGGMEALGYRFAVGNHGGRALWYRGMPEEPISASWNAYALRLDAAMDRSARRDEIIAYLSSTRGVH
ncbi:hypothetical protein [Antarcticirhabdus aurantiaca]|uniref:Uncharacterized protein n=1 Tax=Antarcticirhabdus aurantiaca TaxID=2606717 RepID=A0ACD4NUV6_9HYPH|nr:hypothetical protein [Antarcticirhabdus aurantiaca]WAJ30608.1 hypothetical protein OXU80_10545 [Jeongeuplla avenae]